VKRNVGFDGFNDGLSEYHLPPSERASGNLAALPAFTVNMLYNMRDLDA